MTAVPTRLRAVVCLFAVAAAAVAVRLVQLQWIDGDAFARQAARQRMLVEPLPARPGEIVDRRGRLLAITVEVPSLFAVPREIEDADRWATAVAAAVGIDADRLAADLRKNRDKSFLWVRRRLTEDEALAVRGLKLPAGTFGLRDEYVRRYPQGVLAAHLLGLRDIDDRGRGGVEESCDALLRGRDGRRVGMRDARGRVVGIREELTEAPVPGRTVVLSIDSVIQLFAEQELERLVEKHKPIGCCAIVLDVKSGDLLALASRPTFDPARPSEAGPDAWPNRAVTAVYEPGSTLKPLVAAWAIDSGVLDPHETIFCERGAYRLGRRTLHDHYGYADLSGTDILVKSSNIGMAKIGERLGPDGLHRGVTAFGFGRPTGVSLPGEQWGLVRPPSAWTDYSLASIPMGHELAVTPLQLIVAHGALANGGRLVSPRLVLRDADPVLDSAQEPAAEVSRPASRVASEVLRPESAAWAVRAMAEVVARGTGQAAKLDGVSVFGKTGTAQKWDAAAGGFSHSRYVVSFIAGAPANDPAVLVLVMADEPTGADRAGGTVAAPAAAALLRRTLHSRGKL